MYSERLTELFHSRAHAGRLEDATHYGEAGIPGHGPYIRLWARLVDGRVQAARFKTFGCPAVFGCAEALCLLLETGSHADGLTLPSEAEILEMVGGVPEEKVHCPRLAVEAGRALAPLEGPR